MKYALILLIALGVVWWWRQGRRADAPPVRRPTAPAVPVEMVTCAECGLHLPRHEALADGPGGSAPFYCGTEHRARQRG